eukprot:SAG11_NODE_558_length_8540_cov_3.877147_8_plen_85_part_00
MTAAAQHRHQRKAKGRLRLAPIKALWTLGYFESAASADIACWRVGGSSATASSSSAATVSPATFSASQPCAAVAMRVSAMTTSA